MRSRAAGFLVALLWLCATVAAGCAWPVPGAPTGVDGGTALLSLFDGSGASAAPSPTASPGPLGADGPGEASASGPAVAGPTLGPSSQGGGPATDLAWPLPRQQAPGENVVLHVPILMYHRIVAGPAGHCGHPGLCVAPGIFSRQLGRLAAAGWHTITMATLASDLATGTVPPARTFVITLDDGRRDGLTNGLPILRRYGFVATYYVVTGRLGNASDLHPADLVALAAAGMEIGDHTRNHINLDRLSAVALAGQIRGAARTIEMIVGEAPATFAYPFGDHAKTVVEEVQAAGFGAAVLARDSGPETWANRFRLPRIEVGPGLAPVGLLASMIAFSRHRTVHRHH